MEFIKNYIEKAGIVFVISQCIGFLAAAILLLSYQQKTHKRIVAMQACSGLLFAIQYFLIGKYAGMACNLVGVARSLVFTQRGKSKFADSIACPIVFAIIAAISGIISVIIDKTTITAASIAITALPTAAMIISSFVMWSPKTQKLRALTIPTSAMWLIYNVNSKSPSGTATEIFNLLSIMIALFRFRKKKTK